MGTAHQPELRTGDWVEVRSESEILATLDENGELDRLPFMPEMRKHCGKRFEVEFNRTRLLLSADALRKTMREMNSVTA